MRLGWPRTANIPIGPNADRLEYMEVDDYDQSTGTTMGGVIMYWRAEAEEVLKTKPKLSEGEMKLFEIMGLARLSGRQIEDAPSLSAFYELAFGRALAWALDRAVFKGNGAGRPLGIIAAGNKSLVTVPKEGGQANDTIIAENIIAMYSHLPEESQQNPGGLVWLRCVEGAAQLQTMQIGTGASGQLVYMPPGGLSGTQYGTIYNIPVIPFGGCSKLGDVGDIVLADLDQYLTITKGGVRKDWSMHVYFLTDEMAFRTMFRANGQPMWKKSRKPENATAGFLQSPFITLAAR